MLTKRIIACLDVNAGRVVKGVQFSDLRDAYLRFPNGVLCAFALYSGWPCQFTPSLVD